MAINATIDSLLSVNEADCSYLVLNSEGIRVGNELEINSDRVMILSGMDLII